ncbi:MAG: prolipoprotein diacylglyceryl transferase [Anaerolineales bacterium]|nr:prolipoprotein diacylglyceryl transferase [Anaerolineales bacterium]
MIDPVIFSFDIGSFTLALRWYGLFVASAAMVGAWVGAFEMKRYGENPDYIWDMMVWLLPVGVIGARIWYVVNDIAGGGTRYLNNPISILAIPEGGLHIYGAVVFGLIAAYLLVKKYGLDMRLLLDSAAPALLIAQAFGRPANFINQELYGQPTDLPWGIKIDAIHRLPQWSNLNLYPVETTRFHPAFAYEMLWNYFAAGLLMTLSRRYKKQIKPGTMFAGWLVLAGFGRVMLEFFRPDQPRIPGTDLSYSRVISAIMFVVGVLVLLVKYEVIKLPYFSPRPDSYKIVDLHWEDKEERKGSGQAEDVGEEPESEKPEEEEPEGENVS